MDLLATGINAAVVAAVGLLLGYLGKGRFEQIERRFEQVDKRFGQGDARFEGIERRMDPLEHTVNTRMDGLQRSLDGMRSDITRVALAVGAAPEAGAGG